MTISQNLAASVWLGWRRKMGAACGLVLGGGKPARQRICPRLDQLELNDLADGRIAGKVHRLQPWRLAKPLAWLAADPVDQHRA